MKSNRILTIVVLLSCLMTPLSVFAADGDLDTTYGISGLARTFEPGLKDGVDVAMQNDKSIILAPKDDDFAVLRFNADGTRDMTFGTSGMTVVDFKGSHSTIETNDIPYAVAVQTDGKIVVVGSTAPLPLGKARHFAVARINRNGGLDTTFGTGGIVVTDFFGGPDAAYDVIVQTDNKIVAVGETEMNGNIKFGIARYNSNGSLDSAFANAGIKTIGWGDGYNKAYGVAQQSDGKLVVVGIAEVTPDYGFGIARLRLNGTLDLSFGSSGLVSTTFPWGYGSSAWAKSVAIAPDGKIVVGGGTYTPLAGFLMARYLSDGSLDPSFGWGGKTYYTPYFDSSPSTIAISNGRIIFAGRVALIDACLYTLRYYAILIGYTDSGSFDTTFGNSGIVQYNPYPENSGYCQSGMTVGGMALQSDGNIVVAGGDYLNGPLVGIIAARFLN